jgi:hypothetical protein
MSGHCKQCSSNAVTAILLIVLVLIGVLVIAFFEWQTLRDPRIGSPFILIAQLLETLGVFSLCAARWPGSIPVVLSITSLVNLNTEFFQTECLFGRPHPTRAILIYVCAIPALLLGLLLTSIGRRHLQRVYKDCFHGMSAMLHAARRRWALLC